MNTRLFFFAVVALNLTPFMVTAQTGGGFSLSGSVIAGGGGTSTGGVFSVQGTLGQPVAGGVSGGSFSMQSGFWGVVVAVQTPGAPLLRIARGAAGEAILLWPASSTGWVLQQTSSVPTPVPLAWMPVTTTVMVVGSDNSVTVPAMAGNRFFRLCHP